MIHIGLDLGGTKISGVALDENGRELARERVATPAGYAELCDACGGLVLRLAKGHAGGFSVGVGCPGAVDVKAGVVRFSPNIPSLTDRFFVRDLSRAVGALVRLANDAACFAASEARDGAGAGLPRVYGVVIGTGVGGALAGNGQIIPGPNGFTEWGHVPLPWIKNGDLPLRRCGCGKLGCIESYLSGRALNREVSENLGRDLGNDELNEAIARRVPQVADVMEQYLDRLARAFAMLITILDPHALVLGGGVSNLDILYNEIPARLPAYTPVPEVGTKILKARYGDDSGLRGAAWLGAGR